MHIDDQFPPPQSPTCPIYLPTAEQTELKDVHIN